MSAILSLLGGFALFLSGLSLAAGLVTMRTALSPEEHAEAWRFALAAGGFLACGFLLRTAGGAA